MLSIRSLARCAPRTMSRLTTTATRQAALVRSTPLLRATSITAFQSSQRASPFSTSMFRRSPSGETDAELVAKLESEIQFEDEVKQNDQLPVSIQDFLDNSPFELEDIPGKEEVKLVRTFGDEKITVTFSIADLTNPETDLFDEDRALDDEDALDSEASLQSVNKQRSNPTQSSQAAAEEDLDFDGEEDMDEAPLPCRLSIVVEKPGKTNGALNIDASAQDGVIVVENMFYYEDAKLAHASSLDATQARAEAYPGPPFGSLDEDLQVLMERYLEERGITQALAVFAPDYVDVKEQREYVRWLNNVKKFIDA